MVAGSEIGEISVSSPSLGAKFLFPIQGETNTFDVGGLRADDTAVVDGAGNLINSYGKKAGMFEIGAISNDSSGPKEYLFCVALAGAIEDQVWTVSLFDGTVWKGTGNIQGDLKLDPTKASFALKVVSGQGFVQQ